MRTPSGYPVAYIPHNTPLYTEKCKPCLLCGMFGARSSSGTNHNISRNECVTAVDAWGTCGARERCLGWCCRVMRRNPFSRTSRKIEAPPEDDSLLYRNGSNTLPLPCRTFISPSQTSTVGVSGKTPLKFGG